MTDDEPREVEIQIDPDDDRLEALGASRREFDDALAVAFEQFWAVAEAAEAAGGWDAVPSIYDLKIRIGGQEVPVEAVATITVVGL